MRLKLLLTRENKNMLTRREFIKGGLAVSMAAMYGAKLSAQDLPPISVVGISSAGMGNNRDGMGLRPALGDDAMAFIEYCRSLGAGGVQFSPAGDLVALRRRLDELGMWFEGNARPPRSLSESTDAFEQSLRDTLAMGGNVVRYVSRMPEGATGRRYESFTSLAQFEAWRDEANAIVMKCLPIAERLGVKIALENHKDRTVDEHVDFLKTASSEYLGALVDPGNNLSLIELPEETCAKLAPYVLMVSMKEMGVAPYEDGFLLSEVRMGEGATDQMALWNILKAGNPSLRFAAEMITRDPLKVPCLTQSYWASMPAYSAAKLAAHINWVKSNATELPYVDHLSAAEQLKAEEDNNRNVIEWGRLHLA
jgi:sugar phosphate isomerase/epimerase